MATEKARRDSRKTGATRVSVLLVCAIAVFALFSPENSGADEYHYTNILVGERPAGMGGAYTAVSDDPTGLYYNPAGIVYAPGRKLSASVNAYYSTQKTYKNVTSDFDWKRESSSILPNFFGIIQPLGKGVLGFSYAVPDSIIEDQDLSTNIDQGRLVINYNVEDATSNFGPSYALAVSKNISFGATMYVHYRRYQRISNQMLINADDSYAWDNLYFETEEWGLKPLLGIQWSPEDEKYSVGFTLSRTILLSANTSYEQTAHLAASTDAGTVVMPVNTQACLDGSSLSDCRIDVDINGKRKYPLTAKLGFAYFPTNTILLTGDVAYYFATGEVTGTFPANNQTRNLTLYTEKRSFLNVSLGTEYYFSRKLALRGGFYTNFANTPDVLNGKSGQEEHLDIYGTSLSLTTFTRGTSLTLGVVHTNGAGKAQVTAGNAVQDVVFQSYMFYIGTSYFF